jgi:diguanylate cyclase (GGDEF)-like protein
MTHASPLPTPLGIEAAGLVDGLTGLLRREGFLASLEARLHDATQDRRPFAVLALDLDRFNAVNDTLGHAYGDALLRGVGRRIRSCIRAADVAGRLGGDEFALLLADCAQAEAAAALGERLADMLARPFLLDGQSAVVGCSVGVAHFPQDGTDAASLLRAADLALCQAKAAGRGTVRCFVPALRSRADARRVLEGELRAAIGLGQLELRYQPQVAVATGALMGFEALLRWNHPTRGLVAPADFVPLAEEIGLIVPIGEWVLRTACRQATTWPPDLHVAVNVAAPQFARGDIVAVVGSALAESGLAAHRLEVEVTETSLLHDVSRAIATCHRLRAMGVRISLDDFGTGYSSLTHLRDFPLDRVKIDRSFIAGIGERADSAAIVQAVVALGASLGLRTTAEGVETEDQMRRLLAQGCADAQGFLIARPVAADAIHDTIARLRDAAARQEART